MKTLKLKNAGTAQRKLRTEWYHRQSLCRHLVVTDALPEASLALMVTHDQPYALAFSHKLASPEWRLCDHLFQSQFLSPQPQLPAEPAHSGNGAEPFLVSFPRVPCLSPASWLSCLRRLILTWEPYLYQA